MSPRNEEANRLIREKQRARLAAAATKVFARKGLAATRVSDIAAEAGVSQGLVHHYFESKDALYTELVRGVMKAATEVPALAARQPGSALDRLRWYVRVTLTGVSQSPELVMLAWQAQGGAAVPAEAHRLVVKSGAAGMKGLARLIAAAQASGEAVRGDPKSLAAHLISFIQGLGMQAALGPMPPGYPDLELVMRVVTRRAGEGARR